MKIKLDSPPEEARIEIVPLIDVIFCILTFFILAALQFTSQQAISVDLPKASTGTSQKRNMLLVSIYPLGTTSQIYIDQQPVSFEQLQQELKNYQLRNPQGLMVLYASKDARYNDVVQVLDMLRSVGGDRVGLATLPSSAPQTPSSGLIPGFPSSIPGSSPTTPFNPKSPYISPSPINPTAPQQQPFPTNPEQLPNQGLPASPGITPTPGSALTTPVVPSPESTTSPRKINPFSIPQN